MSASRSHNHDRFMMHVPTNSSTVYGGHIPVGSEARRVIDQYIHRYIRPVRFNESRIIDPLIRTTTSSTNKFTLDAIDDIAQSEEFTDLLLSIYENALSLEVAQILDSGSTIRNPEMIERITAVGRGYVENAMELAGDNEVLLRGIRELLEGCACITETHKAFLREVENHKGDHCVMSVYFSLAYRGCRYYATMNED